MRTSGILLPIFSLPNSYGIGTLGKEAYDFVDFLEKCHQTYWQVLPIGPTSYGDSPYQSFSVFAGNPYFIDFDLLKEEGLLEESDYDEYLDESLSIDYGKIYNTRYLVLRRAYSKFDIKLLKNFEKENSDWLEDFSLFMTLKDYHHGVSFLEWKDEYKFRNKKALSSFKKEHLDDVNFWKFTQYYFFKQWNDLRVYANSKGIKIIGDMPIYVPYDSVEVWKDPQLFMINDNMEMEVISGMPPDDFAKEGQVWGSPVYNYDYMKKDNYSWWVERFKYSMEIYDYLRIDHFIGFVSFYGIDGKTRNPFNGKWYRGGSFELFNEVNKVVDKGKIIAEDLGFVSNEVKELLNHTNYYCMRILEFGMKNKENNIHFPGNYPENCVCYTGTHDNQTLKSWLYSLSYDDKKFVEEYTNETNIDIMIDKLIDKLFESKASIVIIPIQDYLKIADEGRMNTPGKASGNWVWRVKNDEEYRKLSFSISKKNNIY